jgi:ribosomal protein S14
MAEEAGGGELELMCLRVVYTEKSSPATSVLDDQEILHEPQVSFLRGERRKKSCLRAAGSLIFARLYFCRVCFREA